MTPKFGIFGKIVEDYFNEENFNRFLQSYSSFKVSLSQGERALPAALLILPKILEWRCCDISDEWQCVGGDPKHRWNHKNTSWCGIVTF